MTSYHDLPVVTSRRWLSVATRDGGGIDTRDDLRSTYLRMRYQEMEWSCGPSAIVNAARALGKRIAERRVRKLAGCRRSEGTDDWQMLDAIRSLELVAEPLLTEDRTAAWALIRSSVIAGRPVVICIDNWQHWTTVIGVVGDRVLLADPTFAKGNQSENGIHSLSKSELLRRWKHRHLGQWYGIAIGRKR